MVTVWWYAASLIHYSFLNSGKIITSERYAQQINEMHGKPQHLQLAFVNRKGPVLLNNTQLHVTQPMLQKLNELGYEALPHPPYSPELLPTNYHFFKHLDNFLQRKCSHNQQEAENAFQEFIKSWSTDFYAKWISKLLVVKNVLLVMVPILINKDVFMVWNHNYFCINLIIRLESQNCSLIHGLHNGCCISRHEQY